MTFFKRNIYTFYGLAAILLWSTIVALIRNVSELFSPIGGAAMIYTISALFLMLVMGIPKLHLFPKRYLLVGGTLFVLYEMCLALSLGMANSRQQALEMAVINYLWPAITVLLTVILAKRPVNFLVYPSVIIAFIGVAWCIVGGEAGAMVLGSQRHDENIVDNLIHNIVENPIAYFMAFSAAFIWAIYCVVTKSISQGSNAITLFFIATAITLWINYAVSDELPLQFSTSATLTMVLTGVVIGAGYALWNQALIGGNLILLGTLSYFTPVFSTLFSSVYLSMTLSLAFWQGVVLVTLGSLVCYLVTKEKSQG